MKRKIVKLKTRDDVVFLEFVCPKCKTPYGFIGFKLKKVTPSTKEKWFCYIVKCNDDSFYTGITRDVKVRMSEHEKGIGAQYFRRAGKLPIKRFAIIKDFDDVHDARKYERYIKKQTKKRKSNLLDERGVDGVKK